MRNDLTDNFINEMSKTSRSPIQLMEFHFSFGIVYVSDRQLSYNGNNYLPLVENWGEVSTSGYNVSDIISETLEITVTLWNGGLEPFSNYFLVDEPTNTPVFIYQTFEGLEPEDAALIGEFVIQDTIEYSEASRLLNLDLVTPNMRYTANIGDVLTTANWPDALEADLNKGIDLIVGDAGEVKTLCAKTPKIVTMKGSILKLPTIVNVYEDLDELNFDYSGYLWIDEELMYYSSRDADTFYITGRGLYGTSATDHSDGTNVLERILDHTYIIGQGPLSSVSDVRAGTRKVDATEYTLDLASNPATITFTKQPSFIEYPRGARSTPVPFNHTHTSNTAAQAYYAYQEDQKAYGALINEVVPNLAITVVLDDSSNDWIQDGEVVRVFLAVEHWATKFYANDRAIAYIDGIGEIGRLSRPNADDIIDITADVDLDHSHEHVDGGDHKHTAVNPNVNTYNPSHTHATNLTGNEIVTPTNGGLPITVYQGYSTSTKSFTFGFSNIPTSGAYKRVQVAFFASGVKYVQLYTGLTTVTWYNNVSVNQSLTIATNKTSLTFVIGPYAAVGAYVKFTNVTIYTTPNTSITKAYTGVTAAASGTATLNNAIDTTGTKLKSSDDVLALSRSNEPINITQTTTSSKKVTDKFDITKHLETVDWDWLVDRRVQITYTGTNDDASIFITYINFEVEYRQKQIVQTNDIYCKPVGSIENRPDAVLQYILNTIAGIPLESFGSIWARPEVWDDEDIWDDNDIWLDSGDQLPYPDGAAFQEAGARFAYLGYRLDGVIPANEEIRNVVKDICKQARCRILWSGGKVKLAVREKLENWVTLKEIEQNEIQLKSIAAEKESITNTYNDIDLFYKLNRNSTASDEAKYSASVNTKDLSSIAKHGQRKDNSQWLFSLVRDDAMAADLADYYLWRYGQPITKYSFTAYLQQFDIEKDDTIRITSNFARMTRLPLRIANNVRTFGSGKSDVINTIELIGESIRHRLLTLFLESNFLAIDDVSIDFSTGFDTVDSAVLSELLSILWGLKYSDEFSVSDATVVTANYRSKYMDAVNTPDTLASTMKVQFADEIKPQDKVTVSYEPCFGACGFGGTVFDAEGNCTLPFGSVTKWGAAPDSEIGLSDDLIFITSYNLTLFDSIQATEDLVYYNYYGDEVASIEEELIFNSGFGSPVLGSSGFGYSNFGK